MKSITFTCSFYRKIPATLAIFTLHSGLLNAERPVMRDVATHEQLARSLRQTEQEDPMKKMASSKGDDPAKNLPKDLISQSDLISFNGFATLVPKRAILQIPKNFQSRVRFEPGSRIQTWAEFYASNLGWITTVEISRLQAEGNAPMSEETIKQLAKSFNLVVATYMGGPISMLPLKAPDLVKP